MEIRAAVEGDFSRIMEIYARARQFMAEQGNPNQWGPTNWPPADLVRADIAEGGSYVCVHEGRIVGVFFFRQGEDVDPTYHAIQGGAWLQDGPYGVIHRIASDGTVKGVGQCCIDWAMERCASLRMDTHGDNRVMQGLLEKCGFVCCGVIQVAQDNFPRLAYEKVRDAQ